MHFLPIAPLFSGRQVVYLVPLLAATLKYDSKRIKTDDFYAKISKQNMGGGRAPPQALSPAPYA